MKTVKLILKQCSRLENAIDHNRWLPYKTLGPLSSHRHATHCPHKTHTHPNQPKIIAKRTIEHLVDWWAVAPVACVRRPICSHLHLFSVDVDARRRRHMRRRARRCCTQFMWHFRVVLPPDLFSVVVVTKIVNNRASPIDICFLPRHMYTLLVW